jgi:hypothetical protein
VIEATNQVGTGTIGFIFTNMEADHLFKNPNDNKEYMNDYSKYFQLFADEVLKLNKDNIFEMSIISNDTDAGMISVCIEKQEYIDKIYDILYQLLNESNYKWRTVDSRKFSRVYKEGEQPSNEFVRVTKFD